VAVKIRLMRPGEEISVSELIVRTFQRDVAPLYGEQGIREFLSYVTPEAILSRQARKHVMLVATQGEELVGALELREYSHVSLLFVEATRQRKGIGRHLMDEAIQLCKTHHSGIHEITVNASPNAVEAYKRFGFHATGELQVKNGIGFVPMTLPLESANPGGGQVRDIV
jgi:GNAT superfamily N-acetyltransferase